MIPFQSFQCHFQTVLLTFHFIPFLSILLFYNIQTRFLNFIPFYSIPFLSLLNPFHSFNDHSMPFFYKLPNRPSTSQILWECHVLYIYIYILEKSKEWKCDKFGRVWIVHKQFGLFIVLRPETSHPKPISNNNNLIILYFSFFQYK